MKSGIRLSGLGLVVVLSGCYSSDVDSQKSSRSVVSESYLASQPSMMKAASDAGTAMLAASAPSQVERYDVIEETGFSSPLDEPYSTFSIDVDKASWSNIQRMVLEEGRWPTTGAVRIEEMLNSMTYRFDQPVEGNVSVQIEKMKAPWNPNNQLVMVGLQGKSLEEQELPNSNLVALVDVSGSMTSSMSLVRKSLRTLVSQLQPGDHLSIVTYSSGVEVQLPSTPVGDKEALYRIIDKLQAGGATNGEGGVALAYEVARDAYLEEGNNRVVLMTDGDFNVGRSSQSELKSIIESQRDSGIYLSILGFGYPNDALMQTMAQHGNGNYQYLREYADITVQLEEGFISTLYPVARDVKVQVQFNPSHVSAYRLIGYENRRISKAEFEQVEKDAADLGVGQQVIALYEVIPGSASESSTASPRYLNQQVSESRTGELGAVELRYRDPDVRAKEFTRRVEAVIPMDAPASDNIKLAALTAGVGMWLSSSDLLPEKAVPEIERQLKALSLEDYGMRRSSVRLAEVWESAQSIKSVH